VITSNEDIGNVPHDNKTIEKVAPFKSDGQISDRLPPSVLSGSLPRGMYVQPFHSSSRDEITP
jgi:hypothetical protein